MKNLEILRLMGGVVAEDLTFAEGFTNLKELRIYASSLGA